jgi:hypothetical protein
MEDNQKYFFVPIQLLRGLHTDKKKTLRDCAMYGVFSLTQTKKVTTKEERTFIEQFVYAYYNEPDTMTMELAEKMEQYIDEGMFHADADHKGFAAGKGRKLNVDSEIHELERIFEDDQEFRDMVVMFGKAKDAFQFYGMKKDFRDIFTWAMEKNIPPKSPMVMIGQDKLREFLEDDTKTEFEIMTFAIYLAIRSLLGTDKMKFTTKDMILARAFGFRNIKELKKNPPDLYEKYSKRYWMDKCLGEIRGGWNIITYSSNRDGLHGIYIGNGFHITNKDLMRAIEKKRKAKDTKSHNAEMRRLRDEVRKELNYDG